MYTVNCLLPNNREAVLIIPDRKITEKEFDHIIKWLHLIRDGLIDVEEVSTEEQPKRKE